MLGVGSGILASLAAVGFPAPVLAQFAGMAGIGGLIGTVVGRSVFPYGTLNFLTPDKTCDGHGTTTNGMGYVENAIVY